MLEKHIKTVQLSPDQFKFKFKCRFPCKPLIQADQKIKIHSEQLKKHQNFSTISKSNLLHSLEEHAFSSMTDSSQDKENIISLKLDVLICMQTK